MDNMTKFHRSFNLRELFIDNFPLLGLVPDFICGTETAAEASKQYRFVYLICKLHSTTATVRRAEKDVEGSAHDPEQASAEVKLRTVDRAKELSSRVKSIIATENDRGYYDFGTPDMLGDTPLLDWDFMALLRELPKAVWNGFRLQFLPFFLLAGNDEGARQ